MFARAIDEALRYHALDPSSREELRGKLPVLLEPVLTSIELARDTAREPIGAIGHLLVARAQMDAVLRIVRGHLPSPALPLRAVTRRVIVRKAAAG